MANTKHCPVCGDKGTRNAMERHIKFAHPSVKPRPRPV